METAKGVESAGSNFEQELKSKIKDTIGLTMDITLKKPNSIPRSQGGKLSRIVDKR